MYICLSCGFVFEEPDYEVEHHSVPGNPDMSGDEFFYICPCCGEDRLDDADYCEKCGEAFPSYKIKDGLCKKCYEKEYKDE